MESLTRFKSRRLALVLATFSLLLFTACGGDDDTSSTNGTASGDLAENQVLRLSMNSEPGTIDPHMSYVSNEVSVARQLTSGLFTYNEDLEVVPGLAAEMPTVDNGGISEDGTTYTIKLQETTWSDGSALTAEDFVYSALRVLDPNFGSPVSFVLYDIVGAAAYNESLDVDEGTPAPPASEIEDLRSKVGVRAEDASTLVYNLEAPNPSFLNVLAHTAAAPVKQSVVEQFGEAWTDPGNYVGNGPFVLDSWERGSKIIFARNENWYADEATLSRIEVSFITEDSTAYSAYLNNELDAVRASAASLAGDANEDELVVTPAIATYGLFMNNGAEPFDNELVRQAFGSAIDRAAYVSGVLQGAGVATTSWVPPGMPGYSEALGEGLAYDVEGAKDLLTEAGFEDGEGLPEVDLVMIGSDYNTLVGQFIENQLETNLGVGVTVAFFDQGEYFDALFEGEYDATIQSWVADWPAPDNFLSIFHSENGNNFSAYSNPNYDELLDEAALEADPETRLELYHDAQEILLEDAGISPMYNEVDHTFVKPTVLDLIITGLDGALKGDLFLWKTKVLASSGD